MAELEFNNQSYSSREDISRLLASEGILYEHWGVKSRPIPDDSAVLDSYEGEIKRLKSEKGYAEADCIALRPDTPGLKGICDKFSREHHHSADEVRFVVEGAGVFEIKTAAGEAFMKVTTVPGDLIVIPANRRHLFYLTGSKTIRCIRLFRDSNGWEALY